MSSSNHRILGMFSHIAYGVCFIFPPLAIVVLLVDKELSHENKQFMWEALIGWAVAIVLGALTFFMWHILAWVMHAILIFIGVLNLTGHVTHLPFADRLADRIAR